MKKLNIVLSLIILFILPGCNPDDDNSDSPVEGTLIFGWFADSSCSGDCAAIYKIEDNRIYKDIDNNFPETEFFEGNFQLMNTANYQDFEVLITELPNEIFNEPAGYLDCVDCSNENGGFYIEYSDNDGFHRSWRIHNVNYPDYMGSYRSLLLDKLAELNSL